MLSEIPEEEFAAALDACATEVLWEARIEGPPVDTLAVAEELQLVVTHDCSMRQRGRFVRLADRESTNGSGVGLIVVGTSERPEREQWTVAHEIGESVAYRVFERLGVSFKEALPTARELVANRFANALLLPRRWFTTDGRDLGWDLLQLKERYNTASHELIARRMLEMRPPIVITVCDNGRITWRKSNVASRPPEMLREERDVWRAVSKSGLMMRESLDAETGLASVQCWPVHEVDWRRELIRSEITEW
jgi:Zn-dependent peptidase ImmA (M78 family)